jgi:hypothetical protein
MRLLTLLLLFATVAPADAQFRRDRGFAHQGDLALVIGVTGLESLALRPYEGGLGLRYRAADQTVLGAAIGGAVSDRETSGEYLAPEGGTVRDASGQNRRISLALWAEQHLGRRRRTVSPFVGAGVQVSSNWSDDEQTIAYRCPEITNCPPNDRVFGESERTSVGAGLILGAEVRLAGGVTLGGAYTLGAEYVRYESAYSRDTPSGPFTSGDEGDEWRYGIGTTQVGLSVYF